MLPEKERTEKKKTEEAAPRELSGGKGGTIEGKKEAFYKRLL